jgi:hypothetical protein
VAEGTSRAILADRELAADGTDAFDAEPFRRSHVQVVMFSALTERNHGLPAEECSGDAALFVGDDEER